MKSLFRFKIRFNFITSVVIAFFITLVIFLLDITSLFYNKNNIEELNNYPKVNDEVALKNENIDSINKENINILVMADSHLNSGAFPLIKEVALKNNVKLIIHLGDHTDFGSEEELKSAKFLMDSLDTEYIVLPGDRDLAASGNNSIFFKYFKKVTNYSIENLNLLLIDNSPNFSTLPETYLSSVLKDIPTSNIIFFSQPIFVDKGNIFENKYMGSLTAFNLESEESIRIQKYYLAQRNKLLTEIRIQGSKLVVAGDHHRSSQFLDPQNSSVKYLINGATAEYISSNGISIRQKSFQTQRVSIVSVDKNLKYSISEIEIFEK